MSEVELKDNVLVQCPERSFNFRMVKHCLKCEFYNGLQRATVGNEPIKGNEANDFQVICVRPITRKLTQIVEG